MPEWSPEITLAEPAVRAILGAQFPDVDLRGLAPLATGWDNALWLAGEGIAFRFPRRSIAIPGVEREISLLPALAPRVPLPVPVPAYIGRPSDVFPWPFFGARLLPGIELPVASLGAAAHAAFGSALGGFLRALHDPLVAADIGGDLPRDPMGRADMQRRVPATRQRLDALEATGLWQRTPVVDQVLEAASTLPAPDGAVLVHGDLHVRHVLVDPAGMPSGVIDWGDVSIGDPAMDLPLYWSVLDPRGRAAFRRSYGETALAPAQLLRARVLAMYLDATLAMYAHDTRNTELLRATLAGLQRTVAG